MLWRKTLAMKIINLAKQASQEDDEREQKSHQEEQELEPELAAESFHKSCI